MISFITRIITFQAADAHPIHGSTLTESNVILFCTSLSLPFHRCVKNVINSAIRCNFVGATNVLRVPLFSLSVRYIGCTLT